MRVLITGGGGTLGTVLTPLLAQSGHEPVLFDTRPLQTPYRFVQGDVRRLEDLRVALHGVEYVVHLAALLGIQAATAQEFYQINLTGTFNVWEAAVEAGVRGLVFSSTMSVYKPHDHPLHTDTVTLVDEDMPARPRDLYGYTKWAGEQMCRSYERSHGIPSIALRYGMFSPEPFFAQGIRLLYGGVDVRDVAAAVLASLEALASGKVRGGYVFNVESLLPFVEEDHQQLLGDPLPVLERHFPGSTDLLRERGVERLIPIHEVYSTAHAAQVLGFYPEHNFAQWLEALRAQPQERAHKSPPWP